LVATPGERPSSGRSRLGVTVSRRVGNAISRNRVKRGIREWFRQSRDRESETVDIVVIARSPAARLSGTEIARELDSLFHSRG